MPYKTWVKIFLVLLFTGSLSSQVTMGYENEREFTGIALGQRIGYFKSFDAMNGNFYGTLLSDWRPLPYLGLEFDVNYMAPSEYTVGSDILKLSGVSVLLSYIIYAKKMQIPVPFIFPFPFYAGTYFGAGGGLYFLRYNFSEAADESRSRFGWHLTFGFELPLDERVALMIDTRYLFYSLGEAGLQKGDGLSFSGGLLFWP